MLVNNIDNLITGLHINKYIRKTCIKDETLYGNNGKAKFPNMLSARYAALDISHETGKQLSASELFLMSVLEAILLTLGKEYVIKHPTFYSNVVDTINGSVGLVDTIEAYLDVFPTTSIYKNEDNIKNHVTKRKNIENTFLEMLLLNISSQNPAYKDKAFIFEYRKLKDNTNWISAMSEATELLQSGPKHKEDGYALIELLKSAYTSHPTSITDQLLFLIEEFDDILSDFKEIVMYAIDNYKEETKPVFSGPGESKPPSYDDDIYLVGKQQYSTDLDWMPKVVMIAKNVLVWLDQLSKKYKRQITTLDQIPDKELDFLMESGFNGLWLIGLWERSEASKKIKQWTGNPEAEASAYSLKSYNISSKIGGQEALEDFKARANVRGIRLASDMVPNHTSIDSPQLFEHPDWYLQLDYCPYPTYSFTGVSLSGDDRYGVFLEDHYFDKTDAAVVFKYVDYATNQIRYIYHGNDGTNMPWNDTAQLDYLKKEVREAVKQTIINVAKDFPIIRFDAAMTLAKKHYHRLWYPEPGSAGDIPTRASHGLSKPMFDEVFPKEFWREVVDTVAEVAPDTLLLAEAFWLLEGYFVRTLGMHRVYNSAFMHMLRDEENKKYRETIKLTLEFDGDILQRYVNFMSNPDEKTAIEQFGSGDKYFGVCLMMITLPGLPMFAHGQLQGFEEKYGMEYSKAYWDETENEYLMDRHKKEIFPILKKRALFSEIENFRLYDFKTNDGIDENVFAYSNSKNNECALFIYNNKYQNTSGSINPCSVNSFNTAQKLIKGDIASWLELNNCSQYYVTYKDYTTGLEYIRSATDMFEYGLYFNLNAYEYHVLMDFKHFKDNEWGHYGKLCHCLNGKGVESIKKELSKVVLGPLHKEFNKIINTENLELLWKIYKCKDKQLEKITNFFEQLSNVLETAKDYAGGYDNSEDITDVIYIDFEFILKTNWIKLCKKDIMTEKGAFYALSLWVLLRHFGELRYGINDPVLAASLIDEWDLHDYLGELLPEKEYITSKDDVINIIQQIIRTENWNDPILNGDQTISETITNYLLLDSTSKTIKVNKYEDVLWFNKECSWLLIEMLRLTGYVRSEMMNLIPKRKNLIRKVSEKVADNMLFACDMSEYKLENLVKILMRYRKK